MIYAQPTRESIARWQELRAKDHQRAQKALAEGDLFGAICFQELQAIAHEAVLERMRFEAW